MLLYLSVIIPFIFALAIYFCKNRDSLARKLILIAAALHALCVILISCFKNNGKLVIESTIENPTLLGTDTISWVILAITSVLFLFCTIHSIAWIPVANKLEAGEGHSKPMSLNVFYCFMAAFLGSMSLVILSQNLALTWVAIEATTLVSAPLICFHRTKASLEAMWKYLLICSVGIGIALFGTMLLVHSIIGAAHGDPILNLAYLREASFNAGWFKAAFILALAGYGTTGLITYMRTDSLRISEEARADANKFIASEYGEKYLPEKPRYFKTRAGAQDGHEAIRPTNVAITPAIAKSSLTNDQYKLYNLIWCRYVASLMAACIQDTVKAEIKAEKAGVDGYCIFSASGYSIKFDGFTALYEDTSDNAESESTLPEIKAGDALKAKEVIGNQHFTQPPSHYTEASLIKMLEETGVGRPSTYASIVSTIIKREYVKRDGKLLKATELGMATTALLKDKFPKIVNTKFTASMETKLDEIDEGKCNYIEMLHEYYDDLENSLARAKTDMQGQKIQLQEDITDVKCEKCGRNMVVKVGRFGKFLACPGYPECKTTKPLVEETKATCPECGGQVIGKKSKRGYQFYGCSNYPKCNFMTLDKPTGENCPQCGKSIFKGKGGMISCPDSACGYTTKAARKNAKKTQED